MEWNYVLTSVVCIVALAYYYVRKKFTYWADRGVPFVKPVIPFGNLRGIGSKLAMAEVIENCYNALKGRDVVGGLYFFTSHVCMTLDLDVLRHILVKDFHNFTNRGMYVNERDDPLSAHLVSIEDGPWKRLRAKMSPTFTSGKMMMMHPALLQIADQFRDVLTGLTKTACATDVELKDLLARFTTDVIGNVAFGVDCNSLRDPDSAFRTAGRQIFDVDALEVIRLIFVMQFPDTARKLRMKLNKSQVITFVMKMLKATIKYREENGVQKDDFLSLMLQIKNTGKLDGEDVDLGKMTFEEVAAQLFLFFVAGFETSSSTMTFAVYELAINEDVQTRLRDEIREVLARHDGEMGYEALLEMPYLDRVIYESLRKYPIFDNLLRVSRDTYQVPNSKIVLEKGTRVIVPVIGIHRDPDIYPEPMKFDPDRFTKENVAARHPYSFLPFGEGPRNCLGMRFGMMQTRIGLATLVNSFKLHPSSQTQVPLKLKANAQLLSPDGGMVLKVTPI